MADRASCPEEKVGSEKDAVPRLLIQGHKTLEASQKLWCQDQFLKEGLHSVASVFSHAHARLWLWHRAVGTGDPCATVSGCLGQSVESDTERHGEQTAKSKAQSRLKKTVVVFFYSKK